MFCRCENFIRNCVVKLLCWSTIPAMSFTLKMLRMYKNINNIYLNLGYGSKQELKNYSVRNKLFVLFI